MTATAAPASYAASGGSGTVSISADRDCTWSLSANAGWIAVQGPLNGQGEATVPYAVQANPAPAPRSGAIVVSTDTLTVSQAGAPCTFALGSTHGSIAATGGSLSVAVSTLAGCGWSASSGVSWIAVKSGTSGSGSGTAVLAVAANDGAARVGSVNVAGQNYTVAQDARPAPAPVPAPAPAPPPPAPSPTPAPAPPPPPNPSTVELHGSIASVAGRCPVVTFRLQSWTVVTSDGTKYQHGDCRHLRKGASVAVTGTAGTGGTVQADSIAFEKD